MSGQLERSTERKTHPRDGRDVIFFTVRGEEGAVQWTDRGTGRDREAAAPVVIHGAAPTNEFTAEHGAQECDVLPGGRCYPDQGYRGGQECYDLYQAGGEDALFAELEQWYLSRFRPGDAL